MKFYADMTEKQKFNQGTDEHYFGECFAQLEGEAHHNLSGFMSLLIKINEREQVVPTKADRRSGNAD